MKVEGGGHYLRAVNDGARTVIGLIFKECTAMDYEDALLKLLLKCCQPPKMLIDFEERYRSFYKINIGSVV